MLDAVIDGQGDGGIEAGGLPSLVDLLASRLGPLALESVGVRHRVAGPGLGVRGDTAAVVVGVSRCGSEGLRATVAGLGELDLANTTAVVRKCPLEQRRGVARIVAIEMGLLGDLALGIQRPLDEVANRRGLDDRERLGVVVGPGGAGPRAVLRLGKGAGAQSAGGIIGVGPALAGGADIHDLPGPTGGVVVVGRRGRWARRRLDASALVEGRGQNLQREALKVESRVDAQPPSVVALDDKLPEAGGIIGIGRDVERRVGRRIQIARQIFDIVGRRGLWKRAGDGQHAAHAVQAADLQGRDA